MEHKQSSRRGRRGAAHGGSRRPFPPSLALAGIGLGVAALAAALGDAASWSVAFGDALLVEAGICLALAWFAYLRKDGVRIAPRKREAAASASWKERVPGIGEVPPPPMPMPSPEGPQGADYERLAAAEESLRRKILGESDDAEEAGAAGYAGDPNGVGGGAAGGSSAAGSGFRSKAKRGATAGFLAAGGILLILALLFEYAVPALIR